MLSIDRCRAILHGDDLPAGLHGGWDGAGGDDTRVNRAGGDGAGGFPHVAGYPYSDDEVRAVRDFLYVLARTVQPGPPPGAPVSSPPCPPRSRGS